MMRQFDDPDQAVSWAAILIFFGALFPVISLLSLLFSSPVALTRLPNLLFYGAVAAQVVGAAFLLKQRRGVGVVGSLARLWAGKEAVAKALGVGFSGYSYREIEIVNARSGAPVVAITGELAEWASQLGVRRWHLSLSDTKEMAFAVAL